MCLSLITKFILRLFHASTPPISRLPIRFYSSPLSTGERPRSCTTQHRQMPIRMKCVKPRCPCMQMRACKTHPSQQRTRCGRIIGNASAFVGRTHTFSARTRRRRRALSITISIHQHTHARAHEQQRCVNLSSLRSRRQKTISIVLGAGANIYAATLLCRVYTQII